jgi:hypothetical protein
MKAARDFLTPERLAEIRAAAESYCFQDVKFGPITMRELTALLDERARLREALLNVYEPVEPATCLWGVPMDRGPLPGEEHGNPCPDHDRATSPEDYDHVSCVAQIEELAELLRLAKESQAGLRDQLAAVTDQKWKLFRELGEATTALHAIRSGEVASGVMDVLNQNYDAHKRLETVQGQRDAALEEVRNVRDECDRLRAHAQRQAEDETPATCKESLPVGQADGDDAEPACERHIFDCLCSECHGTSDSPFAPTVCNEFTRCWEHTPKPGDGEEGVGPV